MKIAIISDLHSNLEALTAVRHELDKEAVEQIYCLGDILGYNANPKEVLQMVREMNALSIAGNHDHAAVGLMSADSFNLVAKEAVLWSGTQLSEEEIEWVKNLPLVREVGEITFVHATPHHPEEWGYVLTRSHADVAFKSLKTRLCFLGHSHLPCLFEENEGLVFSEAGTVDLKKESRYIINVGSVGQPRDGNPKASYVLYDSQTNQVHFKRVEYDLPLTQKKVLDVGLPGFLAERLAMGR